MTDPHIYDSAFLGILQREGQIASFMDVVMGFLYRRTDFFHLMKSKEDTLGFPPGVAPRILISAYEKYETMSRSRDITKERRTVIPAKKAVSHPVPSHAAVPPHATLATVPVVSSIPDDGTSVPEVAIEREVESTGKPKDTEAVPSSTSQRQKLFQDNPESYNGAVRETYRWAQSISDCDLRINVPSNIVKAKQINVIVARKRIKAIVQQADTPQTLVDLPLSWEVRADESVWSLIPGDCIHINLEKVQERWWESVFEGEPKINVREIDAVVDMGDMDDGAQATVAKLMYDEKQKQLGLPTSEQQKTNDILRKAWDADGSPFKGTPFNPSKVTMN